MKVMIIEDSQDFRKKLENLLSDEYEVTSAVDGQDGLEKLRENKVDLVITDLNMPRLDGLSMLKKIKEEGLGYECPPIMMCTTEFDPQLKKQGKECGVSFWLVKPISELRFLKVIETLLS